MKFTLKSFTLLLLSVLSLQVSAQDILRIHKKGGEIIEIPIGQIDSIDFVQSTTITPPPAHQLVGGYVEVPFYGKTYQKKAIKYLTHSFTYNAQKYRNYEMLYDTQLKMAYWVAYPLCNFYTVKNTKRFSSFIPDPSLPRSEQPIMSKGLEYYSATGRYDRGHQIPSADRLVSQDANRQTFYFTNMTAQIGRKLNQSIWGNLEDKVRAWSKNIDTLYVVTGAMPTSPTDKTLRFTTDNSGNKICVPKYYFKAICKLNRKTGEAQTIAFKLDHREYDSGDNFMKYKMSVAELEKLTGFTFFPSIDAKYKQSYDLSAWR